MAFSYTITSDPYEQVGRLKKITGTFTNTAGSSGGNIDLTDALTRIVNMKLQHTGSAVVASAPVINETFPLDGTAPTIVTVADADGIFEAWGY